MLHLGSTKIKIKKKTLSAIQHNRTRHKTTHLLLPWNCGGCYIKIYFHVHRGGKNNNTKMKMKLTFEEFKYCTVGVNQHCVFKNAFLKIRNCVGQNGLQHVCIKSSSSFECVWIELWSTKSNLLSMLIPVIMYVVSCCNLSVGFGVGGIKTVMRFLSPKMASVPLSTLCTCIRYTGKFLAAFLKILRSWPTTVTVEEKMTSD